MNRLGISANEAAALAPRIRAENHGITLLMSHLACAEQPEHPLNDQQIKLFREVRLLYRGIPVLARQFVRHFPRQRRRIATWCGPGVALYGVNPTPGKRNPMRPVVELQARIVQVRTVPQRRDRRLRRDLDRQARDPHRRRRASAMPTAIRARPAPPMQRPAREAIVAGKRCPLAGRISMDLLAIDITDLPDNAGRRGDLVTLIGDEIGVDDVAAAAGTIGYEVLTSLGRRYHRVYRAPDWRRR